MENTENVEMTVTMFPFFHAYQQLTDTTQFYRSVFFIILYASTANIQIAGNVVNPITRAIKQKLNPNPASNANPRSRSTA